MSIYYDSDEYELTTSMETENLLAELPFELMKESIKAQIDDPVSTSVNYMDTILTKCEIFKDRFEDDPEIQRQVDDGIYDFMTFVISKIDNRFGLDIDLDTGFSHSDMLKYGKSVYNYFILKYVKNISKYIINYIETNRKDLVAYYSDKNKKDVSTLSYKKQIKDQDYLTIITNLPSILNYIVELDTDPFDFVSLTVGEDNYDGSVIKGMIESGIILGDFTREYIDICVDTHDFVIDEIYTRIKTKLIKKYKMV